MPSAPRSDGAGESALPRGGGLDRSVGGGAGASWADRLLRETREHPGRTAALAVGAGYVLGGGLFSRFTARLVRIGLRVGVRAALLPFVTQLIVAFGLVGPEADGRGPRRGGPSIK